MTEASAANFPLHSLQIAPHRIEPSSPCRARRQSRKDNRGSLGGLACALFFLAFAVVSGAPGAAQASVSDGISELARQIVERSAAADRTTIAIAAFPHVDDTCSELSNFLVDELVLSLFSTRGHQLSIIERSQLGRIFAELELSLSGVVDVNTTQELGRVHGVETLLIGSLTTVGDDLRINARLIDTETARVFSAAAVNLPRTSTIEDLMARPAAGGCTMMPTPAGQQRGSAASRTSPGAGLLHPGSELESLNQLLGVWHGMLECDGNFQEIWFQADEALSNGVTGTFRLSSFGGWGRGSQGSYGTAPGTASMTLMTNPEHDGVWFRMAARHYQNVNHDYADTFTLQLVGRDALYGTAGSDQCNEVNLGRRQDTGDGN